MGGLFAGNMLCRAGWKVDLYERVAGPLSDRGAGIVTHDELLSALELAGARVDEHLGVRIFERATIDRHGNIVASLPYDQILTAWSRLLHVLEEAFPSDHYHRGKVLKYVQQDNNSATAHFDDGSRDTADILIGADGIRSTTRAQLMPDQQPEYAGYVAWRGLVNEDELSSAARDQLMDSFAFCLPPGEQMLTYPVAGKENATAKGSRRLNFVWYRPAAFDTELKPCKPTRPGTGILTAYLRARYGKMFWTKSDHRPRQPLRQCSQKSSTRHRSSSSSQFSISRPKKWYVGAWRFWEMRPSSRGLTRAWG